MESIKQLLHLILYCYLGGFTIIMYTLVFHHQKRFKIIKILIYFFIIALLWIKISYQYSIKFNILFIFSYVLGILLGWILFNKELSIFNNKLEIILDKLNYYLKIIGIPPIYNKIKCKIHTIIQYKKHPHLKPKDEYSLF